MQGEKVSTKNIALLASRSFRRSPDSLLMRFVREFEPFLEQQNLYTIESIGRAIRNCGLLLEMEDSRFQSLSAGRNGGIVEVTNMVVTEQLDVVIFLIDPRDLTSIYPEITALKRECVAKGKFFLSAYASVIEWASLTWSNAGNYILEPQQSKKYARHLSEQTIALIGMALT